MAAARRSTSAVSGLSAEQDSGGSEPPEGKLLDDKELRELEETHRDGISAVQIVEIFASRGLRFSEATFRKYVQQGLLPRSRRVGRKGKHRGSMGAYPPKTVRRINAIKRLMADGYTIEEIQEQFLRYTDVIETLEEGLSEVFERFEGELSNPRFDDKARRGLEMEIGEARETADELMRRIGGLSERVSRLREDPYRGGGARRPERDHARGCRGDHETHAGPPQTATLDFLSAREVYAVQVASLVQRLRASGIDKVAIGVPGGLDSIQALLVCARWSRLGLQLTNVLAYTDARRHHPGRNV